MKNASIITALLSLLVCVTLVAQIKKSPDQAAALELKELLSKMTIEEKVAQLKTTWSMSPKINEALLGDTQKMRMLFGSGIGMINPDFDNTPEQQVKYRNAIQTYLRTKTRLGIPAIFIDESHH